MEKQSEFLFVGGPAPEFHPPEPRSGFYEDVAAVWHIPVGQIVHVALREHSLSDLQGRLELSRAPELPLDPREPLVLCIGTIEFSSRQIISWALLAP